jgi:hypothetical protein
MITYKVIRRVVVEYEYIVEAESKSDATAYARDLGDFGADDVVIASESVRIVGIVAKKDAE